MNNLLFFSLFLTSSLSAAPVVFNKALLNGEDERFAAVRHVFVKTPGSEHHPPLASFLHLFPKLGADFSKGFGCGKATPKLHKLLSVDTGEHFTELLGFSDCKTWFTVVLTVLTDSGLVNKCLGGLFVPANANFSWFTLSGYEDLVDFVHDHTTSGFLTPVKDKLSSHPLVFKLLSAFRL